MKDVCAITVNLNALEFLGIDVSSDVITFVQHQDGSALIKHLPGEDRAEETSTDDQIVILLHSVRSSQGIQSFGFAKALIWFLLFMPEADGDLPRAGC